MSNGYATEDLEAILESLEASDEADEADEAAGRPRPFRPPMTASGRGLAPPRPQPGYVTEARLQAALAQVGKQIKTNSDAIKAVNGRVNTIGADVSRQATALKKEIEERKKDNNALRNNVQLATLLPLLVRPSSKDVTGAVANTTLVSGDKVLVDKADSLTTLLPVLLLGGLGTSSDSTSSGSTSSGGIGGFNDPTTLLLVVLAASGKL
jgi:hypothetical protein